MRTAPQGIGKGIGMVPRLRPEGSGGAGRTQTHLPWQSWEAPAKPAVGERLCLVPAHVDPTLAYHERLYIADGEDVVDEWSIDLRGW